MPRKKTTFAAQVRYKKQFGDSSGNSDHMEIDLTWNNDDYSSTSEETGIEIVAFDDLDDEMIPVMEKILKKSWNIVGSNCCHYGFGTCRSPVKAREWEILVAAKKYPKITTFSRVLPLLLMQ